MTTQPKREYEKLIDDVISFAAMQGYATSGNERDVHRESLRKAKAELLDLLASQLAAQKREGELPNPIDDLVDRFAEALRKKLHEAEAKYGYDHGFQRKDWRDACVEHLHLHLAKGDPRDVAAYCAFAWNHGWSLANQPPSPDQDREVSP